jgi:hypothetical protein
MKSTPAAYNRGKILAAAAEALLAGRMNRHERVRLTVEDFPELVPGLCINT